MTQSPIRELLTRARERIATPDRWVQRNLAVNQHNRAVAPWDPSACRFCMAGAVEAEQFSPGHDSSVRNAALSALRRVARGILGPFNDRVTHAEVIAAYDRAIDD